MNKVILNCKIIAVAQVRIYSILSVRFHNEKEDIKRDTLTKQRQNFGRL